MISNLKNNSSTGHNQVPLFIFEWLLLFFGGVYKRRAIGSSIP
jgi:hypothetical protein